jgi:outer membrane lipoprotein-sorting protein
MACGMRTRLRQSVCGCCQLACILTVLAAAARGQTNAIPAHLEQALSGVKTVRTRFVQEKRVALFKHALVTRGRILVEPPDKLLWRVESPIRYALLIDGRQARQWDGETGKTETISLAGNPVFAAVAEQLRAWFGGRYRQLAREYEMRASPDKKGAFVFTPRPETPPAKMLKAVTVTFREDGGYIASIRIDEQSGDVTLLTFEETEINVPLEPEAWAL